MNTETLEALSKQAQETLRAIQGRLDGDISDSGLDASITRLEYALVDFRISQSDDIVGKFKAGGVL